MQNPCVLQLKLIDLDNMPWVGPGESSDEEDGQEEEVEEGE